ncbi:MAG: transcriptional repressor [Pseudomonadota bacterium]
MTTEQWHKFTDICYGAGLKATSQRFEIYSELSARHDHPSAVDIHRTLCGRIPPLTLDTVYRTLNTLEAIGAVRRVEVFDDKARFDGNLAPHHHFVCNRCKAIVDLEWESLDRLELPEGIQEVGQVQSRNMTLRGLCRECSGAVD